MAVDELLQHVHPDAVYHRVALPDDRNALGPWREAVKHYVPPGKDDPLWGELIYGSGEKGEPVAFPSGPEGERLRALLDRNQPAMELLEEGVRRGRLQLPVGQGDDAIRLNCDVLFGLHDLSRMLWVKAKATHAKGDINEECRLVIQVLRIGEMICNGDGLVGDYLMAHWNRKSALNWIRKLAGRDGMPRSVLRDLLLAVERSVASPDGLSQCLRAELCCWALPKIDQLPEDGELENLVDRLLNTFYQDTVLSFGDPGEPTFVPPGDGRLGWRREQIISLLRGHSCPFEKVAAVRAAGELVAAHIHGLDYLRRARRFELGYALRRRLFWFRGRWGLPRGMRYWPTQLTPRFSVEALGPSKEARADLSTYEEYVGAKWLAALQPPTDADIALARERLRRVHSPVGWVLAKSFVDFDVRPFFNEFLTALAETKGLLADRLKRRS